jgi:hypothetical protein
LESTTFGPSDLLDEKSESKGLGVLWIGLIIAAALVLLGLIAAVVFVATRNPRSSYSVPEMDGEEFEKAIEAENPLFTFDQAATFQELYRFGSDPSE